MNNISAIEKLCALDDSFLSSSERDQLFIEAVKENYAFQIEKQPFIKYLAEQKNFSIDSLNTIDDLHKIPPLFVGIMKIHQFCNFPENEIAMVLTSSGTKGQKTQSYFDAASLNRLSAMALACFKNAGWTSDIPAHFFVMGYDISEEKNLGTSWSNNQLLSTAPAKTVNWTILKNENGEFEFDYVHWAIKVIELAEDAPIRLTGFPAFMFQLAQEIARVKPDFKAKPGSFITAGGGWKNHKGTPMKHREFAEIMEKNMGIESGSIRDIFGMAEHGIPYCSCSAGNYHVPVYARLLIRDPLSLNILNDEQEGLMNLITPYNMAQPNLSVLATDLAVIKENCPCGVHGKYISSIRRGGISKNRGCAIAAQELLDKSQGGK
jgi:phenylacetate-coenzyme A ligase PaaK-like adenylate-forming protein